jgi:cephalosporin hydroxylase
MGMADSSREHRLLRGFYQIQEGWRWTSRVFAVSLDPPRRQPAAYLEMDFTLPIEVTNEFERVTLLAKVNGIEVGRQTYSKAGRYFFTRYVPVAALTKRPAEVEFEVDKSVKQPENGRILGLIAISVGLKEYERTAEYREAQVKRARRGQGKVLAEIRARLGPEKQRGLLKLFHELPIWENIWFQNLPIIKNPLDLWMMQQLIYEVQPDYIIETGTWYGGSALYWAQTLNGMNLESSRVLTIDINDFTQSASSHTLWNKYVEFFHGSSTDPLIVHEIASRVKGRKTIVTLDSDHSQRHVLEELRKYAPMVSRGSYLVVEDTHLDGVPTQPGKDPGPMAAVRQFLAEGARYDFESDPTCEMFIMTWNPEGWLRRK